VRRKVRGEVGKRVANAVLRTMLQPAPVVAAPPGTTSTRAEGCVETICGAPIGCQVRHCRFRRSPGYPVQAMGDAE
jgi:hypothetical protein